MIDVRGVGYIVHVSDRTMASLPPTGQAVALYTELLVREDLLQLFGFLTLIDKEWHRLLTSVQGVGAKAAMAIVGTLRARGWPQAGTARCDGAESQGPRRDGDERTGKPRAKRTAHA